MKLLDKLERKFGRYAIHDLMKYIIVLYAIGFVLSIVSPEFYSDYLSLNVPRIIYDFQIWRVVTFIVYPPSGSLIFILFSLYLYYTIGSVLERQWGAFRFNLYYFSGMLFHVVAAFIAYLGWGMVLEMGTYYLNLSMFFAFATFYPDMQFLFMFIIPIKLKWLAILDGVYFAVTILAGFLVDYMSVQTIYALLNIGIVPNKAYAVMALVSLLNFLLFATSLGSVKRMTPKEVYRRKSFEHKMNQAQQAPAAKGYRHKCAICGRTEKDDETLEFRYCSKCNGNYEYCQEHLFTHTHK